MKLKVYFHDSPNTREFDNVTNLTTEGGLVRITQNEQDCWIPLVGIFLIKNSLNPGSQPAKR
jgi:hypothetical protein